MEAIALYSLKGNSEENELSFEKGQLIKILNEYDSNWYTAEINGKDGLVPFNFIDWKKPSYFHGVSKLEAANLLESNETGHNFIIRPSETMENGLSLSVKTNVVQHFKILRTPGKKKFFLWRNEPEFDTINKLVEYYRQHSMNPNEEVFLIDIGQEQQASSNSSMPIQVPPKKSIQVTPKKSETSKSKKTVRAIYNFDARHEEELTLKENDIITLLERTDDEWSKGQIMRGGVMKEGYFPNSYVV